MAIGGILVRNTDDQVIQTGPGTAGQVLTSNGAGVVPTFQSGAGTGTVTHTAGALTAHQVVLGNGSADVKALGSLGTSGQVLTSGGAGVDPSWTTVAGSGTVTTTGSPANGNLTQFSGATSVTNGDLSGDISTSGTLVTAIGAHKVANAMIRQSGALSVIGRSANSTGDVADISGTTNGQVLQILSSVLGFSNIGMPLIARQSGDQTWTTDAALANLTGLSFSIAANEVWVFLAIVMFDAGTTGDIQVTHTEPSGCTHRRFGFGLDTSVTTNAGTVAFIQGTGSTGQSFGGAGAGTGIFLGYGAWVVNSSTAGTVQMQAAQGTSNGTTTTVRKESFLVAFRVS